MSNCVVGIRSPREYIADFFDTLDILFSRPNLTQGPAHTLTSKDKKFNYFKSQQTTGPEPLTQKLHYTTIQPRAHQSLSTQIFPTARIGKPEDKSNTTNFKSIEHPS